MLHCPSLLFIGHNTTTTSYTQVAMGYYTTTLGTVRPLGPAPSHFQTSQTIQSFCVSQVANRTLQSPKGEGMSQRTVRDSTRLLRQCYPKIRKPRLATPKKKRTEDHRVHEQRDANMADVGNGQQVPAPNPDNTRQEPEKSPEQSTSAKGNAKSDDYDIRLKNIEDVLLDMKRDNRARSTARSSRSKSRAPSRGTSGAPSQTGTTSPVVLEHTPRSRPKQKSPRRRSTPETRRSSDTRHRRSYRSHSRDRHRRRSTRSRSHRRTRSRGRRTSSSLRGVTRSRSGHRCCNHRSRSTSGRRRERSRSRDRSATHNTERSPNRNDAEKAISGQYPKIGSHTGKRLPRSRATIEPYRNLPPDVRERARARSSRRALTYPEHMCGMLNMIMKTIDPKSETHAAIKHLAQISQDVVTLMWPGVHQWSQACLSHIEDGEATWTSKEIFHDERTMISWIRGKPMSEIRVPCNAHNVDKCDQQSPHSEPGITHLHVCAVCFYGMGVEKASHNAKTCWKKPGLKLIQDENQHGKSRHGYCPQTARKENKPDFPNKSKN